MKRRTKYVATGVATLVIAGAGVAAAAAAGAAGDGETPITGEALTRASAAALAAAGGGRVTETEAGDEEAYYEVEVTLPDGRQLDVALDRSFTVVGIEGDEEDPNDQEP